MSNLSKFGIIRKLVTPIFRRELNWYDLEFGVVSYNLRNYGALSNFINGKPFSGCYSGKIEDVFDKLRQPNCKQYYLVLESPCFLDQLDTNWSKHVRKGRPLVSRIPDFYLVNFTSVQSTFSMFWPYLPHVSSVVGPWIMDLKLFLWSLWWKEIWFFPSVRFQTKFSQSLSQTWSKLIKLI